jgi:hypothetical protein
MGAPLSGEKLSSSLYVVIVISLVDMPSHSLVLPRRPPAPGPRPHNYRPTHGLSRSLGDEIALIDFLFGFS